MNFRTIFKKERDREKKKKSHVIGERQREIITKNKSATTKLKLSKIESVIIKGSFGSRYGMERNWKQIKEGKW